jgi:hypothetical protein
MLREILSENKDIVVKQWRRAIMESYPAVTSDFLEQKNNQFANPVGHTIVTETEPLYNELIGDMNAEIIGRSLSNIIRIRAVQDFSPSRAVGIVGMLRTLIRQQVAEKTMDDSLFKELSEYEERLAVMQNAAFDIYSECRDRLANARVNETKRRHTKLVEKLSKGLSDDSDDESHTI